MPLASPFPYYSAPKSLPNSSKPLLQPCLGSAASPVHGMTKEQGTFSPPTDHTICQTRDLTRLGVCERRAYNFTTLCADESDGEMTGDVKYPGQLPTTGAGAGAGDWNQKFPCRERREHKSPDSMGSFVRIEVENLSSNSVGGNCVG